MNLFLSIVLLEKIIQLTQIAKHGGKRPRSGRKNEGKVQVCYRLAPDVVEFLRRNERPASRIIEDAVRKYRENENESVY